MDFSGFSAAQLGIIRRLLEGPAWTTLDELVDQLGYRAVEKAKLLTKGRGLEAVSDACADLEADGWVSVQERDGNLTVTLSPAGAERLGVELSLRGKTPRWKPVRKQRETPQVVYYASESIDQVEDTEPSAHDLVTADELDDRDAPVVLPRHYRTGPLWVWLWRHARCETQCEQHRIPPGHHCLYCGRPAEEAA